MKLLNQFLKIVLPVVVVWYLLNLHAALGIGGAVLFIVYWAARNRTGFYAYLGNMNYRTGKEKEAIMWLNKAAARKDCKASHLIGYGFFLLKLGKLELAGELFTRAAAMKLSREEEMSLNINQSLLLWREGRLEEAVSKLEAIYSEYKNTNVYGSLGYFYILSGDLDKALAFNREAYEYNSKGPVIIDNLGQTRLLRGEYEEALKIYEELEGFHPAFPEAYFNHALVLEALGRREEALGKARKALEYPVSLLSTVTREEMEEKIADLETLVENE